MSASKRKNTKAYLTAVEGEVPIWLALTDGVTKTYEIVALDSEQVLAVGSGFIMFGLSKDSVKAKVEKIGYTEA